MLKDARNPRDFLGWHLHFIFYVIGQKLLWHLRTNMKRIRVAGPSISEKEIRYVTDAVTNCWYEDANVYNDRFEKSFAKYIGVRFAVSLPSCTSAIHLALSSLNIGPGDEVIVPDATWIASAAPISYVGASPIFADIDDKSWCLSPRSFEACITHRTKAVIPVDLYGNVADIDSLMIIARRHGIAVIEDAAESVGAESLGRKAGSLGHVGVFSFHGSKTLTTGEGGMLVTDDEAIYRRVLVLRDHGREPHDRLFWNSEVGYKYKMSSMQAALGLAQLERIDELIEIKRRIFSWYQAEMSGVDVTMNYEAPGTKSAYWMVTVDASRRGIETKRLIQLLDEKQIDTRPFFHPLSSIPAYRDLPEAKRAREHNSVSYGIAPHAINLPSALNLTQDEVKYVCNSLKEIFRA